MLKLLRFVLIVAGAFLLFANIEPYAELVKLIFTDPSSPVANNICTDLQTTWFIGPILGWGCGLVTSFLTGLGGFICWLLFQLIELLPIANAFNIPFLSRMLNRMKAAPQEAESESDRESVRKVKQRHNTVVERSLGALLTFSWVVYIVDLLLMSWLYQPLSPLGELNVMGLIRVLLGVFGVELVVLAIALLNNIIDPKSVQFGTAQQREVKEY